MDTIREELKLKLRIKKLERSSKSARDLIEKKLKNGNETKHTKSLLNAIQEKNDQEYCADGCENFITD